jgi:hypothetical protein
LGPGVQLGVLVHPPRLLRECPAALRASAARHYSAVPGQENPSSRAAAAEGARRASPCQHALTPREKRLAGRARANLPWSPFCVVRRDAVVDGRPGSVPVATARARRPAGRAGTLPARMRAPEPWQPAQAPVGARSKTLLSRPITNEAMWGVNARTVRMGPSFSQRCRGRLPVAAEPATSMQKGGSRCQSCRTGCDGRAYAAQQQHAALLLPESTQQSQRVHLGHLGSGSLPHDRKGLH